MLNLSSYPPRSKGPMSIPTLRTSAVTFPRQLAPTVGPAHAGVEILEGALQGMEGFVTGRITRSQCGKLYIDDSTWGPEADSVESGYRVPIGSIHIFIGRTYGSEPEPDLEVPMETSSQRHAGSGHAFVGFISGPPEPECSVESLMHNAPERTSYVDSYTSEGSLYDVSIQSVGSDRLGPRAAEYNPDFPHFEPMYCVTVFMADTEEQGSQGIQNATQNRN